MIREDQAHRIKEKFQTIALALNNFDTLAEMIHPELEKPEAVAKMIQNNVLVIRNICDGIFHDMDGMIEGARSG